MPQNAQQHFESQREKIENHYVPPHDDHMPSESGHHHPIAHQQPPPQIQIHMPTEASIEPVYDASADKPNVAVNSNSKISPTDFSVVNNIPPEDLHEASKLLSNLGLNIDVGNFAANFMQNMREEEIASLLQNDKLRDLAAAASSFGKIAQIKAPEAAALSIQMPSSPGSGGNNNAPEQQAQDLLSSASQLVVLDRPSDNVNDLEKMNANHNNNNHDQVPAGNETHIPVMITGEALESLHQQHPISHHPHIVIDSQQQPLVIADSLPMGQLGHENNIMHAHMQPPIRHVPPHQQLPPHNNNIKGQQTIANQPQQPVAEVLKVPLQPGLPLVQLPVNNFISNPLAKLKNAFANLGGHSHNRQQQQQMQHHLHQQHLQQLKAEHDRLKTLEQHQRIHQGLMAQFPHGPRALRLKRSQNTIGPGGGAVMRRGFQVITSVDLDFFPNITTDSAPVYEGRREEVVYGVCMPVSGFAAGLSCILWLIVFAFGSAACLVYKLDKFKKSTTS